MPNRQLGFELEVASHGPEVTRQLHDRGVLSTPLPHHYHCHCTLCDYNVPTNWKGQRDSSIPAGVELISPILLSETIPTDERIDLIEDTLVGLGAAVTQAAGMHVHVNIGEFTPEQICDVHDNFIVMERPLYYAAIGGFPAHRGPHYARPMGAHIFDTSGDPRTLSKARRGGRIRERSYHGHGLNFSALNHGCVEWRIWNSTRAAWRMRFNILTSVYFSHLSGLGVEVPHTLTEMLEMSKEEQIAALRAYLLQVDDIHDEYETWFNRQMMGVGYKNKWGYDEVPPNDGRVWPDALVNSTASHDPKAHAPLAMETNDGATTTEFTMTELNGQPSPSGLTWLSEMRTNSTTTRMMDAAQIVANTLTTVPVEINTHDEVSHPDVDFWYNTTTSSVHRFLQTEFERHTDLGIAYNRGCIDYGSNNILFGPVTEDVRHNRSGGTARFMLLCRITGQCMYFSVPGANVTDLVIRQTSTDG